MRNTTGHWATANKQPRLMCQEVKPYYVNLLVCVAKAKRIPWFKKHAAKTEAWIIV